LTWPLCTLISHVIITGRDFEIERQQNEQFYLRVFQRVTIHFIVEACQTMMHEVHKELQQELENNEIIESKLESAKEAAEKRKTTIGHRHC